MTVAYEFCVLLSTRDSWCLGCTSYHQPLITNQINHLLWTTFLHVDLS
jgi:hypothetical protein